MNTGKEKYTPVPEITKDDQWINHGTEDKAYKLRHEKLNKSTSNLYTSSEKISPKTYAEKLSTFIKNLLIPPIIMGSVKDTTLPVRCKSMDTLTIAGEVVVGLLVPNLQIKNIDISRSTPSIYTTMDQDPNNQKGLHLENGIQEMNILSEIKDINSLQNGLIESAEDAEEIFKNQSLPEDKEENVSMVNIISNTSSTILPSDMTNTFSITPKKSITSTKGNNITNTDEALTSSTFDASPVVSYGINENMTERDAKLNHTLTTMNAIEIPKIPTEDSPDKTTHQHSVTQEEGKDYTSNDHSIINAGNTKNSDLFNADQNEAAISKNEMSIKPKTIANLPCKIKDNSNSDAIQQLTSSSTSRLPKTDNEEVNEATVLKSLNTPSIKVTESRDKMFSKTLNMSKTFLVSTTTSSKVTAHKSNTKISSNSKTYKPSSTKLKSTNTTSNLKVTSQKSDTVSSKIRNANWSNKFPSSRNGPSKLNRQDTFTISKSSNMATGSTGIKSSVDTNNTSKTILNSVKSIISKHSKNSSTKSRMVIYNRNSSRSSSSNIPITDRTKHKLLLLNVGIVNPVKITATKKNSIAHKSSTVSSTNNVAKSPIVNIKQPSLQRSPQFLYGIPPNSYKISPKPLPITADPLAAGSTRTTRSMSVSKGTGTSLNCLSPIAKSRSFIQPSPKTNASSQHRVSPKIQRPLMFTSAKISGSRSPDVKNITSNATQTSSNASRTPTAIAARREMAAGYKCTNRSPAIKIPSSVATQPANTPSKTPTSVAPRRSGSTTICKSPNMYSMPNNINNRIVITKPQISTESCSTFKPAIPKGPKSSPSLIPKQNCKCN